MIHDTASASDGAPMEEMRLTGSGTEDASGVQPDGVSIPGKTGISAVFPQPGEHHPPEGGVKTDEIRQPWRTEEKDETAPALFACCGDRV